MFDVIEPFADYSFPKAHSVRLRLHRVPDRVPEGELPGAVPRRAAHEREVEPGQGRGLPQRVPAARHPGARPRRQRFRERLRRAAHVRRTRRGVAAAREVAAGAIRFGLSAVRNVGEGVAELILAARARRRAVRRLLRLLRARRPDRAEQAHDRVADQGRRVRLARSSPPGPAARVRADRRPRAAPPARARPGHAVVLRPRARRRRRPRRDGSVSTSGCRSPTSSSTRRSSSRSRRRCSASTCPTIRSSAPRRIARAGSPTARSPRCSSSTTARCAPSPGIVSGAQPQVHEARRPHGHVRARGSRRRRSR